MKPLRIIAAGILETAYHLWQWWRNEVQERPHHRIYDAPTARMDGKPLARCTCDATYRTAPCAKHPEGSVWGDKP